jgi:molybdopterin molybdotransferase
MVLLKALHWQEARDCVRRLVGDSSRTSVESVGLASSAGRVLGQDIFADRSYPPFPRSTRDGYAVRSEDIPGSLRIVGEVRAGEPATLALHRGECIEIMTGAPAPNGADAVLMVEHAVREGASIKTDRSLKYGENISPAGCEASAGDRVLETGTRLDYAHIAILASVGAAAVSVHRKPRVAMVATGDEIVDITDIPKEYQIRNSNAFSLAAQVERAGGVVASTTLAADTVESLRNALHSAFECDLVLLSGGVSAGKYDLVEVVLAEFDAEFFFTRVLIQPGQPAVFGRAKDKFFFGLPGNPVSTMVTFELFARLALELLAGEKAPRLSLFSAQLSEPFHHKTGLTRFLPAKLSEVGPGVTPVRWQGSGDVFAVGRANAFLVADSDRPSWNAGESIRVLAR